MNSSNGIKEEVRSIKFPGGHFFATFYHSNGNEIWLHFLFQLLHIQVASGIGQHAVVRFGCDSVEGWIEVNDGNFIFQAFSIQGNTKLRGSFLRSGHRTVETILTTGALQFQLESRAEQSCGITKATAIYAATARNINQVVIVLGFTLGIKAVSVPKRIDVVSLRVDSFQPVLHIFLGAFGKFLIGVVFIKGYFTHTGRAASGDSRKAETQDQNQNYRNNDDSCEDLPQGFILWANRRDDIILHFR